MSELQALKDRVNKALTIKRIQELQAGPKNMPRYNPDREAGWLTRMVGGLKMTNSGRAGLAESLDGVEAFQRDNGDVVLFDRKTNEYYPYDSDDINSKDFFADFTGDAAQVAGTVAAGTNPLTVGAAAAGSNAVRQGVSNLLPGDDGLTLEQRLGSVALDGALGAATQFGVNKLLKFGAKARPKNIVARNIQKRVDPKLHPEARRGEQLANKTGVDFTLGQRSGSKGLLTLEGLARRHLTTADKVAAKDLEQLTQAYKYLDGVMAKISPNKGGKFDVGDSVSYTYKNALDKALKYRSSAGKYNFELVDVASQGKPVLGTGKAVSAIDEIITEFDVPGGGDATANLVNKLKNLRKEFMPPEGGTPMALTGNQFQRLLEIYGKASKGTGEVLKDIDKAQQRYVAGKVYRALTQELDEAAEGAYQLPSETATALKNARDYWKRDSQAINEISESVLGRLMGGKYEKSPERIAESFLSMRPSELVTSYNILETHDPVVAQSVKRLFIEEALTKAGKPQASLSPQRALGDGFQKGRFIETLRKSPVWELMSRKERAETATALRAFERLADRANTDGSPTAPLQFAFETAKSLTGAAAGFDPVTFGRAIAVMKAPDKLAEVMVNPEARKAVMTVAYGTKHEKKLGAAAFLASLVGVDGPGETEQTRTLFSPEARPMVAPGIQK